MTKRQAPWSRSSAGCPAAAVRRESTIRSVGPRRRRAEFDADQNAKPLIWADLLGSFGCAVRRAVLPARPRTADGERARPTYLMLGIQSISSLRWSAVTTC
jgi:hypothetical protein